MTWDTEARNVRGYNRSVMTEVQATKLGMGQSWDGTGKEREVNAVDWGYDMVSRMLLLRARLISSWQLAQMISVREYGGKMRI